MVSFYFLWYSIIFSYGPFFTMIYLLMLWLIDKLHKRNQGSGKIGLIIAVVFPIFYIWDLFVEGVAARLGCWSYIDCFRPGPSSWYAYCLGIQALSFLSKNLLFGEANLF